MILLPSNMFQENEIKIRRLLVTSTIEISRCDDNYRIYGKRKKCRAHNCFHFNDFELKKEKVNLFFLDARMYAFSIYLFTV